MKTNSMVTIIMATYNRANYIAETLQSIQNQTYSNWECLIIDDGGTDNTLEIISPILKTDNRFQFFKRSNNYEKGLPGSRNFGLDKAKGDYVIFFDDDDIVHPQNLELCVKELNNSEFDFCRYVRAVFVKDFNYDFDLTTAYTKFQIGVSNLEAVIKNELPINSCAIMWKKKCFESNRFTEHLMYAEEWELYSRILSSGYKGVSINKTLFYGRKHAESNTGEFYKGNPKRIQSKKEAILLIFKNLINKDLLSESLLKYLTGLAIILRDYKLLKKLLLLDKTKTQTSLFIKLKYLMYPIWKRYKKI
ncbi:glycosyltransferase family 2 protein [uncultured Algibacter sp.]|uniref:glycosyltransferase family 2 protein n=1 Tax=uncultured Algibacter sp. TaxID=298659 RepID=UPI00260CB344|nr:glycosyltransferase family 2 protein [uncultured Algibacter sp.]